MAANSAIEWTDASWNCLAGCEAISPGCARCYAATMTRRLEAMGQKAYAGLTTDKHFNGTVRCLPEKLTIPLRWKKPRRIFVNSMSDLFHEDVPFEFIAIVFGVMAACQQHTFQVLTKRAERMQEILPEIAHPRLRHVPDYARHLVEPLTKAPRVPWPLPNVWLGVSVEDQQRADERIPLLLKTPAAVRFLSCEPLLGPLDIYYGLQSERDLYSRDDRFGIPNNASTAKVDWVIVGGESGPHARPMHPDWARSLRDQCQAAGVPFFFKQWGEWAPIENHRVMVPKAQGGNYGILPGGEKVFGSDSRQLHIWPDKIGRDDSFSCLKVGKKAAGRLLDGREWNEFPEVRCGL